ncbi:reverse transcriptase domain-containing protein [Tanacetum coccineum]
MRLVVYNIKQKEGENTRANSLPDLPTTYKGLMEKTYTLIEAREVATNGTPNDHREGSDRFNKKFSWDNNKRKKNKDMFSPYRGKQSRDTSKYRHFHEDHGHDTNQCRELRYHIEEAVKSGQLAHLVKGIKKGKAKIFDTQLGKWKKGEKDTTPVEAPILMMSRESHTPKRKSVEEFIKEVGEITFPLVFSVNNSSDRVIIGLNIWKVEPVKQKKRGLAPERNEVIHNKVEELTKANILREVKYQTWVSNPVMVRKDERRWKLCVDFMDINKACLKDYYPLPAPAQIVECLSNFQLKCFLDANKGYHHIPMAEGDEEKIAFFTREGVFYYRKLPFVDDMVIKSESKEDMLVDIQETLDKFRAINMKLIPRKCSFGIEGGLFLGYLITKQGIKTKPSKMLQGAELEYPELEKLILALIYIARRLQRYLQAHPIQILTDKPIKQILTRPEKSGRIAKWAIEIGEHEIEFQGCNSVKGHILADFLAETPSVEDKEMEAEKATDKEPEPENAWKFKFETNNNEAEYEAILAGLPRQPVIKQYLEKTKEILKSFSSYSMEHVRRNHNKKVNALNKLASITFSKLAKEVLIKVVHQKSIVQREVTDIIKEEGDNWMLPIREYLQFGILPSDPRRARKLRIKGPQYRMIDDNLYHKSYMSPWLRCVGNIQAKGIIQEGIDIVGPLSMALGGARFFVTAINYFIKWVEAKPLVSTMGKHMEKFVWEHNYTLSLHLSLSPQANGQVEVTNRDIVKGIERRLGKTHQGWVDELRQALWAHRKTQISNNEETPFNIVYGSKAVVPIEISVETKRIKEFKVRENEKRHRREIDSIREAYYKHKLEGYYNKHIRPSTLIQVHTYFDLAVQAKQNSKEK